MEISSNFQGYLLSSSPLNANFLLVVDHMGIQEISVGISALLAFFDFPIHPKWV